jgi:hypothetical protein
MDINELILTSIVLEHAKILRKAEATDLSAEPPSLAPYIAPAVEELIAWHPLVMQAVRNNPT